MFNPLRRRLSRVHLSTHPPTYTHTHTPKKKNTHTETCGSFRSFSCRRFTAPVAKMCTALRSRAEFRSSDPKKSAHSSHFFLEKLNTTQGKSPSFLRRFSSPCHCVRDPAALAHRAPPPPRPACGFMPALRSSSSFFFRKESCALPYCAAEKGAGGRKGDGRSMGPVRQ